MSFHGQLLRQRCRAARIPAAKPIAPRPDRGCPPHRAFAPRRRTSSHIRMRTTNPGAFAVSTGLHFKIILALPPSFGSEIPPNADFCGRKLTSSADSRPFSDQWKSRIFLKEIVAMKHKLLALVLALTPMSWAQTEAPAPAPAPQQNTAPAEKKACSCCDKMSGAKSAEGPSCCARAQATASDGKTPSCCAGKSAGCCSDKNAKSCTRSMEQTATACNRKSCGKQCGKSCSAKKADTTARNNVNAETGLSASPSAGR